MPVNVQITYMKEFQATNRFLHKILLRTLSPVTHLTAALSGSQAVAQEIALYLINIPSEFARLLPAVKPQHRDESL